MLLSSVWDLCLPTEICKMVIDYAGSPPNFGVFNPRSHYPTLWNCALVCSSWLPRSRRMLYRRVHLPSEAATSLLVRTLIEQPFLASLVHELEVEGSSYVPFAQGFLLRHLQRLDTLNLYNLDLSQDYPPVFPSLITHYPIQNLMLWNCSLPLTNIFCIIWSLDNLRSLTL
ncbi:hypothetical protein C8T65DRAFT_589855, partial [Cerioporus squamosus]